MAMPLPAPHSQSQQQLLFSARDWSGHLPCVCQSTRGCRNHRLGHSELFYNPLLPPSPPMRLLEDGGRRSIVDSDNESPRLRQKVVDLFSGLSSKLRNTIRRNNTKSEAQAPDGVRTKVGFQPPQQYSAAPSLFPNVPYYPGQLRDIASSSRWSVGPTWPCISDLPFNTRSFGTLTPMHPSIPYHLAFYHLEAARRCLERDGRTTKGHAVAITQCICQGGFSNAQTGHNYSWSSEIYFWRQRFLQKQEVAYRVDVRAANSGDFKVTMCPHFTVSLVRLKVNDGGGGLKASGRITYKPPRYRHDRGVRWESEDGSLAEMHICTTCHCDLEQSLEVRGHELHVRFTVYRNLGTGVDRFDTKWNALLTGKGALQQRPPKYSYSQERRRHILKDQPSTYGVYQQVWTVAHRLKRPNVHLVTFKTASGDFTALSMTSKAVAERRKQMLA
ncbi:uncharacterized protein PG986_010304 [Apiospora aurea]|uniref:Uncharacterized protein n=1 Tax=Apiospora aurea TaxID=335848 RepID=A0ABR1QA71_9PEZI